MHVLGTILAAVSLTALTLEMQQLRSSCCKAHPVVSSSNAAKCLGKVGDRDLDLAFLQNSYAPHIPS